jgi:neutral ceramidase
MIIAGAASRVTNNELGTIIQGASVNQRVKYIRDNLEANALYLRDGEEAVLLVSCDLACLQPEFNAAYREAAGKAAGIDPRNVLIAGTHTHSGPSVVPTNYVKPLDTAYLERLGGWIAEAAAEAAAAARPARVAWGLGHARIGYNRRCCWADGTHSMHGDTSREDFTGLEGPDDPRHLAMFFEDEERHLIAVFHNNTSHPTSFYGADFLSADFPGEARRYLREALGEIPVLYFNGAFGDQAQVRQDTERTNAEPREVRMVRAAHLIAGETMRLLHEARWHEEVVLRHLYEDIGVPVRLPAPEAVADARALLARVDAGEEVSAWDTMFAHGTALLQDRFGEKPVDVLPVHAVRIGEVGLATQPCELFCTFGLDIKRRSPAPLTAVCGVTDGGIGYCPTAAGVMGGGYSGQPLYWSRLAVDAGDRIVDAASKLLRQLWKE